MCGIVGFVDFKNNLSNKENILKSMMSSIHYRGPDSCGHWHDLDSGLSLGHVRLSIIDVSNGGHQPMHSKSGRYTISYNGEIYNFKKLKKELEEMGMHFVSSSDTEVLLSSFEQWGIDLALKKIEGMFSISLFDKENKNLYLIRDRIGEKPLYYGFENNIFFFGSEIHSFYKIPQFKKKISNNSINTFLHYGHFLKENSIFEKIKKIHPGSYIKINLNKYYKESHETIFYWKLTSNKKGPTKMQKIV